MGQGPYIYIIWAGPIWAGPIWGWAHMGPGPGPGPPSAKPSQKIRPGKNDKITYSCRFCANKKEPQRNSDQFDGGFAPSSLI